MKKKIISASLIFVIVFLCSFTACANVINYARYTDIIAVINDYNIESYNIDGYTAVVAEDLANYGFTVTWDSNARAIYISRDVSNAYVASTYIAPVTPQSMIGKPSYSILSTDISTFINGVPVRSFNIGGKTVIFFEDLGVFGNIKYNSTLRRLSLDIYGLNRKISAPELYSSFLPSGLYFETNSVGGIQVRWTAKNNTNKTINYYTTTYYMFNSVGDFAYDDIKGECFFRVKTVGPVKPGEMILNFDGKYETSAYCNVCSSLLLYTIELEYSDGTSETVYYGYSGTEE